MNTKGAAVNKKTVIICLAIILWTAAAANFWRFSPPDPDCVKAISLYSELLEETSIIGPDYSSLTTTLGSFAAKKSSENPVTAAIMVKLLKNAGAAPHSALAINASGSFPGFVLAALSACSVLDIKTYVIASVGSSTFGANMPGNTIADILLKDRVRRLGYTLLAVTPGGSGDRGMELDTEELERISEMLAKQDIAFIRPDNLSGAIALRESLFRENNCNMLINIGGSHSSGGDNTDLALASGLLKPKKKFYRGAGIIQVFLADGKTVIQILNVRKLYNAYGLDFDENGKLAGSAERVLKWKKLSLPSVFIPILALLILPGIPRYSGIKKRRA